MKGSLAGSHEESDGGEDPTRVEGVVHLLLCCVDGRRVNHHPPTGKELGTERQTGSISTLVDSDFILTGKVLYLRGGQLSLRKLDREQEREGDRDRVQGS